MTYDDEMITHLAAIIRRPAAKAGSRGIRMSYEWLQRVLDGDAVLTRKVLFAAGFTPPSSTEWSCGRGERPLDDLCFTDMLSDNLTDVLDMYDRDAKA